MKKREKVARGSGFRNLARGLYQKLSEILGERIPGREEVRQNLRVLHLDTEIEKHLEDYYVEKTALLLEVLAAGICMAALLAVKSMGSRFLTEEHFLPRRETAYTCELRVGVEGEVRRNMTVRVEPRKLSKEESRELLDQTLEEMDSRILGKNSSLEEVREDLQLIRGIEGTPVTVEWEMDSYLELNLDGSLRRENLKEEGSMVELTAYLSCNGEEAVYRTCVQIFPPVLSAEEMFLQELSETVERFQEQSKEEERQELPSQLEGQRLTWGEERSMAAVAAGVLTILSVALLYTAKDRELRQKIKEREQQMCRDYTRIVSKLTLLMGAGATIRTAWDLIVSDYQRGREEGRETLRYAYEEMVYTSREMQNGMAEAQAYENFGIRCRIPSYLKLSALLEQNLKKGNKGLTELLHAEAAEAFAERKELARCRGEEASTKLLAPMILMLIVVMLLILVPAGISMQA